EIAEANRMRPARIGIIGTDDVCICVVLVGEGRQVNATKPCHTKVVVVTVPVEEFEILSDVEVRAGPTQTLVERHAECFAELGKGGDAGELLAILIILLVLEVVEPLVLDEVAACPPST